MRIMSMHTFAEWEKGGPHTYTWRKLTPTCTPNIGPRGLPLLPSSLMRWLVGNCFNLRECLKIVTPTQFSFYCVSLGTASMSNRSNTCNWSLP